MRALQDKKFFLVVFMVIGFVMKLVAEFVHEVFGHGLFVLLFGGEIIGVHISILWPYELSYICWNLPDGINSVQMAWIYMSGILISLCLSFVIQVFLFLTKKIWRCFALSLFWLAFWTFISATGYLLVGGLAPFGDVFELIKLGVLTESLSFVVGFMIFIIGFIALSWILRRILTEILTSKGASLSVVLFWLIIPMLLIVMVISPERNLQAAYFPLAFLPVLLSFAIEYFMVLSKQ